MTLSLLTCPRTSQVEPGFQLFVNSYCYLYQIQKGNPNNNNNNMLWNKYRSVEDKVKRSRHKRAWIGILIICGIASVMVLGTLSSLF